MFIADLHIHSRYSRATSRDCVPEVLDVWARKKGIALVGTGDFTHPAWRAELAEKLIPAEEGLFTLRPDARLPAGGAADSLLTRFVVTGEISTIYKKNGRVRKVHSLILLPGLEEAEALSRRLEAIGNLHSDGRPILGLDCRDLLEITLESCPRAVFIPAHIWTPHFSLFGAFSGFDTLEECFGDLSGHIHALETGLSSDPPMNWRLSALDGYQLVSNSDAHSPARLGREANLLDISPSYTALARAITTGEGLEGTIEFFPEEGKYHYDGHRRCAQCLSPAQAEAAGGVCPVCGRKLTTGVLHRVEQLADRPEGFRPEGVKDFVSLVPLPEVIAASVGGSPDSAKNRARYEELLRALGPEMYLLRQAPLEEVAHVAGPCVAEGLRRLRLGQVVRTPGYDGAYGVIGLLSPAEREQLGGQVSLFRADGPARKAPGSAVPGEVHAPAAGQEEDTDQPPAAVPNPAQQAAARAPEPTAAVAAGPGTGKTRTLVDRIAWLLEQGAAPGSITAVTFTNRGAAELRVRLEGALGKPAARAMTIGTFHGICQTLLRREGPVRLAVGAEALDLAGEALRETGSRASARGLLEEVSRRKEGLPGDPALEAPAQRYTALLAQEGLRDYDDLLLEVLSRWEGERPPRLKCFTHLLVDEFQDCSPLQYRLVLAWSRRGESLFVIGDPDQAIYGFRGADGACFDRLAAHRPGLGRYALEENYRSTPEILSCALSLIGHNPGEPRQLAPRRPSGGQVRLLQAESQRSEAVFVAKEINAMVGGVDMLDAQRWGAGAGRRSFGEVAVCCRTRRQLALLEQCLAREGIPCVVAGRDDCLSDRTVRGALAFFRLLLDPGDVRCLERCLHLIWDCPAEHIQRAAQAWAQAEGNGQARAQALADNLEEDSLKPWLALTQAFAPRADREPPHRLLADWTAQAGCTGSEAMERLENMAVFHRRMGAFLDNLDTGREGDLLRRVGGGYDAGAVTLSTFHAAKGLEYSVVFLCGLRAGLVPLEGPGLEASREEERRLFYVALTRACEELILLTSGTPSPFLAELPDAPLARGRADVPATPRGQVQLSLF